MTKEAPNVQMTKGGGRRVPLCHSDFRHWFVLRHFFMMPILHDELVHIGFHSKR